MSGPNRCTECNQLTLERIPDKGYMVDENAAKFFLSPTTEQAACEICSLIRHSLRYDRGKLLADQKETLALYLFRNPPVSSSERLHQIDVIAMPPRLTQSVWLANKGGVWHFGPPDDKVFVARGTIGAYCSEASNSHLASFMKYRLPSENVEPAKSMKLAAEWLNECVTKHSCCGLEYSKKLPTRVIDVGRKDSSTPPILTETRGQSGRYAALSYCWGATPFFKMTSSNKSSLKSTIPLNNLPTTIRDAIHFTRILGIRYLWVDSICIIQGTDQAAREDWSRESRKMREVFGGATLTIAASGSTDAHQGIFKQRLGAGKHKCAIPVSRTDSTSILLMCDNQSISHKNEPLSQRGWAFQERKLSARILSFDSSELSWSCRSCDLWESACEFSPPMLDCPRNLKTEADHLYLEWMTTVEAYSATKLTLASDRLPAIEGIVDLIHVELKADTCYGGIWIRNFRAQLLWRHIPPTRSSPDFKGQETVRKAPFLKSFTKQPVSEDYEGTRPAELQSISEIGITMRGELVKIDTIRCAPRSRYSGVFDNYPPWRRFSDGMVVWIDDVDAIPPSHKKIHSSPKEIINVWFFFVRNAEGLILIKEGSQRGKFLSRTPPTFKRIGVFWGYTLATCHPSFRLLTVQNLAFD
ncbi:HET-domain-containing protein [Hypoxylon rubiginosum]|uniref:HET-domain-containing protein n=1 Tax=Hypoxylon rubiginosum TaxID=110542 RepID=A0ACC0D814_9PEZI|nr:HET-domain-containing protein [Hypoxylon rubiginosum]